MISSINPFSGQIIEVFEPHSPAEVERGVALAWQEFHCYKKTPLAARAAILTRVVDILDAEKRRLAALMTEEMGKTLQSAEAEVVKCVDGCRYYAETAAAALADMQIPDGPPGSSVKFQPLGPILAIIPWNFPFWQVFRCAAPALMAGNTVLLKHAPNVPRCALVIEDIFRWAGLPEGAFQILLVEATEVEALINDNRVAAVTLTGSETAGSAVASQAGRQIKKTVLELGGSDPFIIMPSANLEAAVSNGVKSRAMNGGQACISAQRFIIADSIYQDVENKFVQNMKLLKAGDPMDPTTDIGPLAGENRLQDLDNQVRRAVAVGAKVLTGGRPLNGHGCLYEPTVLVDVPRSSEIYREEFFGPVAMLFHVQNAAEAIELANDKQ